MAEKIGFQDGIEAARIRWNTHVDPGKAWPDKLAQTLKTLKEGHNEYDDSIKELLAFKEDLLSRPF